uniref:Uncharacterized protein n=1 Tax=Rhodococcus sp. NS1 TaxID=402236 RepID=A0A097SQ08_9NOCA|nr:hypothetical protein LRS1606.178 [Rhodococcus sp. NS1]
MRRTRRHHRTDPTSASSADPGRCTRVPRRTHPPRWYLRKWSARGYPILTRCSDHPLPSPEVRAARTCVSRLEICSGRRCVPGSSLSRCIGQRRGRHQGPEPSSPPYVSSSV